jgi:hypothetical protein
MPGEDGCEKETVVAATDNGFGMQAGEDRLEAGRNSFLISSSHFI